MKPTLHRIYIKPDRVEEKDDTIRRAREAGIHIEVDKREQAATVTGTVVAIGSTCFVSFGTTAEEQGIKVGSRVFYVKHSNADVPNSDLVVINDEDILGVEE